jgi:predicted TIM-barrel fold metal-dependent hydrolase
MQRLMLFSTDCHAGLRTADYRQYLEQKYHDDLALYLEATEKKRGAEGQAFSRVGDSATADAMRRDYERRAFFATRLDARLPVLEADGFVGEVLFPDASADNEIPFAQGFGGVGAYSPELHAAALRAYNRWLAETSAPGRQLGLGTVSLLDPDYAAAEVQHFRYQGLWGVMPQWDGVDAAYPRLYDPSLERFWASCADQRLPVNFHSGSGMPPGLYERDTPAGQMVATADNLFWCRRPLWHMVFGGVLERHPGLRVGFVETFADWIPRTLEWMDWLWTTRGGTTYREGCPRPPSEYWARQCFVGAHAASLIEQHMRDRFAPGTFTYGTDFPHTGSPWGHSREFLQATMGPAGVTEDEARAMLGGNAAAIYGLDIDALAPLVESVGPTFEEIAVVPPDRDPSEGMPAYLIAKIHRPLSML